MTGTIKTNHAARVQLIHGEDCEGCLAVAVAKAAAIVSLAGWRIVRTQPLGPGHVIDPRDDNVEITEEWTP